MDNQKTMLPAPNAMQRFLATGILLSLALLAGCNIIYKPHVKQPGHYYVNPQKKLPAVGRAILVELDNDSSYPQISADMTEALFQAMQKRQVFSVAIVRQTDPDWRSLQIHADTPYTIEQLGAMRRTLKCNAVMVGTVTTYQPYPHMSIGLRLRLVDLADGQLLWAFEQIWDTTDKATEKRIANYFQAHIRSGFAPMREQLVAVSSLNFVKFVAYEVAETM